MARNGKVGLCRLSKNVKVAIRQPSDTLILSGGPAERSDAAPSAGSTALVALPPGNSIPTASTE
jgi:hypothetical protein